MYCDPVFIRGFKSAKNEEIKKIVVNDLIIVPFIPPSAETTFEQTHNSLTPISDTF
jgi:hypothetical protein